MAIRPSRGRRPASAKGTARDGEAPMMRHGLRGSSETQTDHNCPLGLSMIAISLAAPRPPTGYEERRPRRGAVTRLRCCESSVKSLYLAGRPEERAGPRYSDMAAAQCCLRPFISVSSSPLQTGSLRGSPLALR